jgi:hypothetical protein
MKKTLATTIDGNLRKILSFEENKKGDVYINLCVGHNYGLSTDKIHEHRYSVHPSHKSEKYIKIKKTLRKSADPSDKDTSHALSKAVKSSGYAWIVSVLFPNPSSKSHDILDTGKRDITLIDERPLI